MMTNEQIVLVTAIPSLRKHIDELNALLDQLDPSVAYEARMASVAIDGVITYMENNQNG